MRTIIEQFNRLHLAKLQEQRETATTGLLPSQLDVMERDPWTITLTVAGEVMMCGGVVKHWAGRGEAWAILSEKRHDNVVTIHRAALAMLRLAQQTLIRIEATVKSDYKEGRRWVEHLGFQLEFSPCRSYFPDGSDAAMYARFR